MVARKRFYGNTREKVWEVRTGERQVVEFETDEGYGLSPRKYWHCRKDLLDHLNKNGLTLDVANNVVRVDSYGRTAEVFLAEMFKSIYCDDCGGDTQHHTAVPFESNWFARCDFPPDEDGNQHPKVAAYRAQREIEYKLACKVAVNASLAFLETASPDDIASEIDAFDRREHHLVFVQNGDTWNVSGSDLALR